MHHDQDMRNMGGLRRRMPVTWLVSLVGSLALIGFPFFSGFYSKDSIIEAVHLSRLPGAGFASFAVTVGVFITALYTFRMYFLVFEGKPRYRAHAAHHHDDSHAQHGSHEPHESPAVVTWPLVALAVPSVVIGAIAIDPLLFGGFFGDSIRMAGEHGVIAELREHFHGWFAMGLHGFMTLPFWLAMAGVALAWFLYLHRPELAAKVREAMGPVYTLLDQKYYMDRFNDWFFAGGARAVGGGLWRFGDVGIIDGVFVNGSAKLVGWFAGIARKIQSGFVYHYAFMMIIGVFVLMTWWFLQI
jgi:NADH-quinone oxidoreductase subunit L